MRTIILIILLCLTGCSDFEPYNPTHSSKTGRWYRDYDMMKEAEYGGVISIVKGKLALYIVGAMTSQDDDKEVVVGGDIYYLEARELLAIKAILQKKIDRKLKEWELDYESSNVVFD